jgi:hypothetical protein
MDHKWIADARTNEEKLVGTKHKGKDEVTKSEGEVSATFTPFMSHNYLIFHIVGDLFAW